MNFPNLLQMNKTILSISLALMMSCHIMASTQDVEARADSISSNQLPAKESVEPPQPIVTGDGQNEIGRAHV